MSTQQKGFYNKYIVNRTDLRDLPGRDRANPKYIVLDITYDLHARVAALAYADEVENDYPELADDIRKIVASQP